MSGGGAGPDARADGRLGPASLGSMNCSIGVWRQAAAGRLSTAPACGWRRDHQRARRCGSDVRYCAASATASYPVRDGRGQAALTPSSAGTGLDEEAQPAGRGARSVATSSGCWRRSGGLVVEQMCSRPERSLLGLEPSGMAGASSAPVLPRACRARAGTRSAPLVRSRWTRSRARLPGSLICYAGRCWPVCSTVAVASCSTACSGWGRCTPWATGRLAWPREPATAILWPRARPDDEVVLLPRRTPSRWSLVAEEC